MFYRNKKEQFSVAVEPSNDLVHLSELQMSNWLTVRNVVAD